MATLRLARSLIERALIAISLLLMVTLAVLVVVAVAFRYGGASLTWYDEIASILLVWITYYGAALAALRRAHLGFPLLVAALPPILRVPLLLVTEALVILFFALVAFFGWRAIGFLAGDYLISIPWISVGLTLSALPIGAVLFIAAELLTLPDRLAEALKDTPAVEGEQQALEGGPR